MGVFVIIYYLIVLVYKHLRDGICTGNAGVVI